VIRLFNVYYPVRTLILLAGEALIVWTSFLLGTLVQLREDSYIALNYEGGYFKILVLTGLVLVCSHWFDLYDPTRFSEKGELYYRLLLVPGLLAFLLAAIGYLFPHIMLGGAFLIGLIILTFALLGWRTVYSWLVQQPYLRERVFILGTGERAQRVVLGLRQHKDLGFQVVGWTGDLDGVPNREDVAEHLMEIGRRGDIHRVIVAMPDRRGALPVRQLLELRLEGVKVEDATSWLEKMSGRIEIENLYPSWLIFAEGFRFSAGFTILRRALSTLIALTCLLILLPVIPFVVLAIKLDSKGPAIYKQKRVGRNNVPFYVYKFRTMRPDAEAKTGAIWAGLDDPRITRVGKFLRASRLDEIPQLWCVLKGDMAFVGPRPERPEFVEWLTKEIPYYPVRHVVRPGITGWAQVRYKYGNTVEDAKEKLQYDLFYIKNISLGLDLLIMFQTVKTIVLARGAQ